eukprot:g46935.t1
MQKSLIDPNTGEKLNLSELIERCIVDKETGLTLFPIKQLAGGMVCLKSGRKVSIFRAIQEGLIDQQVMVRLLEAQLFAGGIVDPRTGHRLTVDEAVRHNLIDHDIACSILIRQIQMGGVIDPVSGQRLTLDEAVQRDLMTSRSALVILQSQLSFKGLLWPESGEVLPMANALQQGLVSTELAHKILKKRATISELYVPETTEVLSWEKSIQHGFVDSKVAEVLKSIHIPDMIPNIKEPSTANLNRLNWWSASESLANSNLTCLDMDSGTETSDSQIAEVKLLSYLMAQTYIDVHTGNRLLLIDTELNDITKEIIGATVVVKEKGLSDECNGEDISMEINAPQFVEICYSDNAVLEQNDKLKASDEKKTEVLHGKHESTSDIQIKETIIGKEIAVSKKIDFVSQELGNKPGTCEDVLLNKAQPTTKRKKKMVKRETDEKEKLKQTLAKSKPVTSVIINETAIADKPTELQYKASISNKDTDNSLSVVTAMKNLLPSQRRDDINKETIELQADAPLFGSEIDVAASTTQKSLQESHDRFELYFLQSSCDGVASLLNTSKSEPILCEEIEQDHLNETIKGKSEKLSNRGQKSEQYEVVEAVQYLKPALKSIPTEELLEEKLALSCLIDQLQSGGIIDDQTGQKLALNEAVAKGVLQSHTALKLMEKLCIFSGFFDPQSCETLTVAEAVDEGLVDEQLIHKIFNSEKDICGVIDPENSSIHSVKDAAEVGLLDQETAARILEGQVVSGGIIDLKRGKRLSVTLASKMGLVDNAHLDNLTKLEKAIKGKESDEKTRLRKFSLQLEMNGIVDPQTKECLTIVEARKRGILDKATILNVLKKQVVLGGINHDISGTRLSVTAATKCGLVDQDIAEELIEVEKACQHVYLHPKTMQPVTLSEATKLGLVNSNFALEVQELQALSGRFKEPGTSKNLTLTRAAKQGWLEKSIMEKAMASPEMSEGIVDPAQCMILPYSELIKKGKIDMESGKRYLEVGYFTGIVDDDSGRMLSVAEAVKAMKVDPVPALRLLQAQADSGGIVDSATGNRMTLAKAAECELVGDNMLKTIATNQLLNGGIFDALTGDKMPLVQAAESGLISQKVAKEIQFSLGFRSECTDPDQTSAAEMIEIVKPIMQKTSFKELSSNEMNQILPPRINIEDQLSGEIGIVTSKSEGLLLPEVLISPEMDKMAVKEDLLPPTHGDTTSSHGQIVSAQEALVCMDKEMEFGDAKKVVEEMEFSNASEECLNIMEKELDICLEMSDCQKFVEGNDHNSGNGTQSMICKNVESKSDQEVCLVDNEKKEPKSEEKEQLILPSIKDFPNFEAKGMKELIKQRLEDEISRDSQKIAPNSKATVRSGLLVGNIETAQMTNENLLQKQTEELTFTNLNEQGDDNKDTRSIENRPEEEQKQ